MQFYEHKEGDNITGIEFENMIEQLLIKHNISFEREGNKISYGHKSSNGKYDFKLRNCNIQAIECKCVNGLNRLTYPKPNTKCPMIKTHQLKALRTALNGIILIMDYSTNKTYSLTPKQLDKIIIENGFVSLKNYLVECDIEKLLTEVIDE